MATYDIGDEVVLTGRFTDEDGEPADPTAVVCLVRDTAGDVEAVTADNTGTVGEFEARYAPTEKGTYYYRFAGTGAVKAAGEKTFTVRDQRVVAP